MRTKRIMAGLTGLACAIVGLGVLRRDRPRDKGKDGDEDGE